VIGSSIVLAGQAIGPGGASPGQGRSPHAAASLAPRATEGRRTQPPATADGIPLTPILKSPDVSVVTEATIDLQGTLPEGLAGQAGYRLRVYVNEELVRERRVPRRRNFTLGAVPLEQGTNTITLAISGPGGESLHSTAVELIRDDEEPLIRVLEPRPGGLVRDEEILLRGRSEAGATVRVLNETTDEEIDTTADEEGAFEAPLRLALGENTVRLRAEDAAGNRASATITLTHEPSAAAVALTVSHQNLRLGSLPASIVLRAVVTDDAGAPIDGAEVTFSVSPPGQTTSTFLTQTERGTATWRDVRIPREGAVAGQGYATVLAVLPDGDTLQGSAVFTIR
jgi:hypothetical protein